MREMDLGARRRYVPTAVYIREELLPALPGFTERTDGSLAMVYEGYLFEIVSEERSNGVAVTVAAPGQFGLLNHNVADLSFDLSDKWSILKAVGELMQKARSRAW